MNTAKKVSLIFGQALTFNALKTWKKREKETEELEAELKTSKPRDCQRMTRHSYSAGTVQMGRY